MPGRWHRRLFALRGGGRHYAPAWHVRSAGESHGELDHSRDGPLATLPPRDRIGGDAEEAGQRTLAQSVGLSQFPHLRAVHCQLLSPSSAAHYTIGIVACQRPDPIVRMSLCLKRLRKEKKHG